ncbi:MAG: hypothetical protein K8U57_12180 [Planctomycetes bacterium]|nr:hypothetical protein [Planctomycetota bacterium]
MAAQRAGTVSVATLSGLVLTLVAAELLAPRWVQSLGLDVWNFHALREEARITREHSVAVEAERVRLRREVEASGHTANRLIDGRITLADAIDELEPILQHRVGFECAWLQDPPPTFRHSVARYIINRVEATLEAKPEQRTVVSARLKAEYDALK